MRTLLLRVRRGGVPHACAERGGDPPPPPLGPLAAVRADDDGGRRRRRRHVRALHDDAARRGRRGGGPHAPAGAASVAHDQRAGHGAGRGVPGEDAGVRVHRRRSDGGAACRPRRRRRQALEVAPQRVVPDAPRRALPPERHRRPLQPRHRSAIRRGRVVSPCDEWTTAGKIGGESNDGEAGRRSFR